MSSQEPGRAPAPPALAALPQVEDLPAAERGYDPDRVRDAYDAFRRHIAQLQAQLRVLQAAGRGQVAPSGHSVRMDALHLIRGAAEFADMLERDAQNASAAQLGRTEEDIRRRQRELRDEETRIERFAEETERERAELVNAAKAEAKEIVASATRDARQELRDAEVRGARLLEQARHQATELTNSARAEVEQTLEWARSQAGVVLARAQEGAEQLLRAAGLGEPALTEVVQAILLAAERVAEAERGDAGPAETELEAEPQPVAAPVEPAAAPPPPPTAAATPPPPPTTGAAEEERAEESTEVVEPAEGEDPDGSEGSDRST